MKYDKKIKINVLLVLLCSFCFLCTTKAQAADVPATAFTLDGSWVSGEISTEGEEDFYVFTIPEAGWVTITYQGFSIEHSKIVVLDENLAKTYEERPMHDSSATVPKTDTFTCTFEAGTYYIRISGWSPYYYYKGNYTGDYRLNGTFEAANNNESSNNDDFATAQQLELNNMITGLISRDDYIDFFRIDLPSKQTVRLVYTSRIYQSYMEIWDGDYKNIFQEKIRYGSENSPVTYTYENTLSPGTYYIKIGHNENFGRYTLKYEQKIMVSGIQIAGKSQVTAGKSIQLKASVSPSDASNPSIQWDSGNKSIAEVDSNGKVTTYQAGVVNITATAQDGSNVAKIYSILVTPKKMSSPRLYNWYDGKMDIIWDAQSGVSGYQVQYATNKSFTNAKTTKVSNSSKTVKVSKKKYYVRVRAYYKKGSKYYYGSWSAAKSIKITH